MYSPATNVAPFQQHTQAPLYNPIDACYPIQQPPYQRMTPPFNLRPLDTSPYRPINQFQPWSPTLSTPPPPMPRQQHPQQRPMDEEDPMMAMMSKIARPSTPEWFPADHILQPPAPLPLPPLRTPPVQSPYKPLPVFDSPFSKTPELVERDFESMSPFTRSSVDSSPSRITTPPLFLSDVPETSSREIVPIHKKVMENYLLQQPASSTPLCEIVKEGQICHLRRYERAGVFVRSTVKFDKAFKHLSNLRENLQHLVIGFKSVPTVFTVDLVTDNMIISLLQSLPNLQEVRFHGFTQLTKQSFDAALIHCPKLRVLAITGTRVPGPEPRKVVFSSGRPQYAGGTGALSPDTLRSLMPNNGPIRGVLYVGRYLRLVDLSFQPVDESLARAVTSLPERGDLVIMRELQTTTERYIMGVLEVSEPVDGSKCQGLQRPLNPVASTVGWPAA